MRTTKYFGKVNELDWFLQGMNMLSSSGIIAHFFPNLPQNRLEAIERYEKQFGIRVTPYAMELIESGEDGLPKEDEMWSQLLPKSDWQLDDRPDSFKANQADNWEEDTTLITPIAQHLYPNRVCLRFPRCLGHCAYCFETRQVTWSEGKRCLSEGSWRATLRYIRQTPTVEEVVLSGGDPLSLSQDVLDRYLWDLEEIPHVRFIRFHTRALTFCPMHVEDGFCELLSKHRKVNAVHLHIAHWKEIATADFDLAVGHLRACSNIHFIRAQTPLLRGVNDDLATLRQLFLGLYEKGIDPYYLIHPFPFTPTAQSHRLPVRRGVELMLGLKRHITNAALPEYIICPLGGKHTVPLTTKSSPGFRYTKREDGWPVVKVTNWQGNEVEYLDSP